MNVLNCVINCNTILSLIHIFFCTAAIVPLRPGFSRAVFFAICRTGFFGLSDFRRKDGAQHAQAARHLLLSLGSVVEQHLHVRCLLRRQVTSVEQVTDDLTQGKLSDLWPQVYSIEDRSVDGVLHNASH